MELREPVYKSLAAIVGEEHVLRGAGATAGFAVDWTGRFRGRAAGVVRPRDTAEVAAVLAFCTDAGVPVVPQGGNTGLVGGGVPLHGEVVLSLARLTELEAVDREASQVTAGAGVALQRVADADPELDFGIQIASRGSATAGGAIATNAGGVRVLRYGPMRAQMRGIEAVLADGTVLSHLAGLTKDNTGYDYPSLLAGSEGTLAVVTKARLRLVPRLRDLVTVIVGLDSLAELHALAREALVAVPGLVSAEFFTEAGLSVLVAKADLPPPLPVPKPTYLLLEAGGPGALDDLAGLIAGREAAVAESPADRRRLWSYRERHPEAAGFLGIPIKLDVSVPAAQWTRLASEAASVTTAADPGARVITFGHVADGNVHVNIVPSAPADGRHEDAVFSFVASLGGSISAEHGIGALKARWLGLARSEAERSLFARIRAALDPAGILNPHVLSRLPGKKTLVDPVSSLVISWLSGQALTAGKGQLTRWFHGAKQQNALRKVVLGSIGPAVAEVVAAEDRELVADVLLRIGPDSAMPETWDAASLRDLVSMMLGPRLAALAEQGYYVQPERLSAALASRIGIGIQADAAHGGVLGPAAELLRHQEAMSALTQVKQCLGPDPAISAVHTLPAGNASFTGRAAELERVAAAAASGGTVGILTIDGMAGIGKTAFAVQAARQVAPVFPDGQFYVRLHGHTPGRQPADPGAALGALLGNLGISADQVPAGTEERAALWRDRMGGKRAVLVLDDATGSDQVRPLLPGTPETLVLITSRRRLAALPEAVPITLDVLSPTDAARLLVALTGRRDLKPSAAGVPEVTRLCGYLPLAISLTGGFLKHHSSWTVPDMADDLASAANRVVAIAAEDVSVAAAFDLSYRELTAAQQRMFRRLGLMPGPDIDAYAAAALDDTDLATARKLLDGLYVTHLADEHARRRYRLHDLIREHAVTLAAEDDAAERDAATSRMLDYYAYCAQLADEPLARRSHTSQPLTVTTPPAHAPALSTLAQANAWMLAERANLHAAVIHAAHHGNPAHATAIAIATHAFLRIHGYWDQALDLHGVALGAARAASDRPREAETLNNLGVIQRLLHDYPAASASLTQALDLYQALGNRLGEANALSYLGVVQRLTRNYPQARESLERALKIYADIDDLIGQANALNYLGVLQHATGEPAAAAASQQQAVSLYRQHGDPLGEANALLDLGVVQQVTGDYPSADTSLHLALTLYQETGGRLGQAHALKYLGSTRKLSGDHEAATASLLQAFELYRELGNQRGQDDVRRYMDNS